MTVIWRKISVKIIDIACLNKSYQPLNNLLVFYLHKINTF